MKLESPSELWVGVEGWEKGGRDPPSGETGSRPRTAGRGAAGRGAAEAEEGAARGGAARSGYSRRAVQTEGGKRSGPTRTWRGGCHSRASLGPRRRLLPGAPSADCLSPLPPGPAARSVRARLGLQVGGSGGPKCVWAFGRPRARPHFAFQVLGLESCPEADLLAARPAPGDTPHPRLWVAFCVLEAVPRRPPRSPASWALGRSRRD